MPTQIELLKKYGLSIRGNMGQHLLIDPNIQRKIAGLLDLKEGELVFEIGPGLGALTHEILERGAKIFAVEKDPRFVEILKSEYGGNENFEVVNEDIIKFDFAQLQKKAKKKKIKAVSNLPYYITAPILFILAEHRELFSKAVVMMQKEVARRITASPGSKDYGRLTLALRYGADVRHAFDVPPPCFTPQPEVSSSVLELTFHAGKDLLPPEQEKAVFDLIELAFSQRRKTLLSILAHKSKVKNREEIQKIFEKVGIKPSARGEELLFKDYLALSETLR